MLTVLKEYLTNRVYVITSNEGLGGNWGLRNIHQQWRTTKKQLTNNTEHVTKKTNPWAQVPEVCEKAISTKFVLQPVKNMSSQSSFVRAYLSAQLCLFQALDKISVFVCTHSPSTVYVFTHMTSSAFFWNILSCSLFFWTWLFSSVCVFTALSVSVS